ncbi:hypothetical protein PCE1_002168 [Barthelona sp. PCE]
MHFNFELFLNENSRQLKAIWNAHQNKDKLSNRIINNAQIADLVKTLHDEENLPIHMCAYMLQGLINLQSKRVTKLYKLATQAYENILLSQSSSFKKAKKKSSKSHVTRRKKPKSNVESMEKAIELEKQGDLLDLDNFLDDIEMLRTRNQEQSGLNNMNFLDMLNAGNFLSMTNPNDEMDALTVNSDQQVINLPDFPTLDGMPELPSMNEFVTGLPDLPSLDMQQVEIPQPQLDRSVIIQRRKKRVSMDFNVNIDPKTFNKYITKTGQTLRNFSLPNKAQATFIHPFITFYHFGADLTEQEISISRTTIEKLRNESSGEVRKSDSHISFRNSSQHSDVSEVSNISAPLLDIEIPELPDLMQDFPSFTGLPNDRQSSNDNILAHCSVGVESSIRLSGVETRTIAAKHFYNLLVYASSGTAVITRYTNSDVYFKRVIDDDDAEILDSALGEY